MAMERYVANAKSLWGQREILESSVEFLCRKQGQGRRCERVGFSKYWVEARLRDFTMDVQCVYRRCGKSSESEMAGAANGGRF